MHNIGESFSDRIVLLTNNGPEQTTGRFVLYWMQASVRTVGNHALEYAVHAANLQKKPLLVVFVLTENFPGANSRHYRVLLDGLRDVSSGLQERRIPFALLPGNPVEVIPEVARDASAVVTDRGYLRIQRKWRETVSRSLRCPLFQIETNVVVPVDITSDKEEYSAATIRKKVHRQTGRFLEEIPVIAYSGRTAGLPQTNSFDQTALQNAVFRDDVPPGTIAGGEREGRRRLHTFVRERLDDYAEKRNDPALDWQSGMSPYLHFGQISPVEIARTAMEYLDIAPDISFPEIRHPGLSAFLEELVVRRELAINFVQNNQRYDSFSAIPDWARRSLLSHKNDSRPYSCSIDELENAETGDPYWNACQREVLQSGSMHGYMRMYWGKKIIEWTADPEEAYERMVYLNDRWQIDGRDPNGYAGIAWCFGKHDRPWVERPIFGTIRYMNANGLRRKFAIDVYEQKWRYSSAAPS